MIHNCWRRN